MKKLLLIITIWFLFIIQLQNTYCFNTPNKDFKLIQTTNQTLLKYKTKTIYTWSHISKENPFVWDEWCEGLTKKLDEASKNLKDWDSIDKQKIWESLWIDWQKNV